MSKSKRFGKRNGFSTSYLLVNVSTSSTRGKCNFGKNQNIIFVFDYSADLNFSHFAILRLLSFGGWFVRSGAHKKPSR